VLGFKKVKFSWRIITKSSSIFHDQKPLIMPDSRLREAVMSYGIGSISAIFS